MGEPKSLQTRLNDRGLNGGAIESITDVAELYLQPAAEEVLTDLPEGCLGPLLRRVTVPSGAGWMPQTAWRLIEAYDTNGNPASMMSLREDIRFGKGYGMARAFEGTGAVFESGSLYIKPSGGYVTVAALPTIDESTARIPGLPDSFMRLVALRAALPLKERDIRLLRGTDLPAAITLLTIPADITDPAITYSNASAATWGALGTAGVYTPPSAPTAPASATTVGSIADLTNYVPPTDIALDYTNWQLYAFGDGGASDRGEDPEMTAGILNKLETQLREQAQLVEEHWRTFQAALAEWTESVAKKAYTDAELAHTFAQGTYQGDIAAYRAQVESALAVWKDADAEYQASILKAKSEAEFAQQAALVNADKTMAALIADFAGTLGNFQAQVAKHSADTTAKAAKFDRDVVVFRRKVAAETSELSMWQGEYARALKSYADMHNHPASIEVPLYHFSL